MNISTEAMTAILLSLDKVELEAVLSAYIGQNMTVEDVEFLNDLINRRHHLIHDLQDSQEVVA